MSRLFINMNCCWIWKEDEKGKNIKMNLYFIEGNREWEEKGEINLRHTKRIPRTIDYNDVTLGLSHSDLWMAKSFGDRCQWQRKPCWDCFNNLWKRWAVICINKQFPLVQRGVKLVRYWLLNASVKESEKKNS